MIEKKTDFMYHRNMIHETIVDFEGVLTTLAFRSDQILYRDREGIPGP